MQRRLARRACPIFLVSVLLLEPLSVALAAGALPDGGLAGEARFQSGGRAGGLLTPSAKPDAPDYAPGEIIVKFKRAKLDLRGLSAETKLRDFRRGKGLEKKAELINANASLMRISDGKSVAEKITELRQDASVEYVQPNYRYHTLDLGTDDTYKDYLWGLDNTGQTVGGVAGTPDADIDAPEAWALGEGTGGTAIVAVIDEGVAYNHPDLIDNMWDGSSCKDEDGAPIAGGCQHGYDFESEDADPLPTTGSHGTHVAGTIAAAKNNGLGIAGVAPHAKIMALKSDLTTDEIIRAIAFAQENGAQVINASWGGSATTCAELYDTALYNAIRDFDGLLIAAAGNDSIEHGSNFFNIPSDFGESNSCWAGLDNVIGVAATTSNDALANFSDFGADYIDVGAPGQYIASTYATETELDEDFEGVSAPALPGAWTAGGTTTNNWGSYAAGGDSGNILLADTSYLVNGYYAANANTHILSAVHDLSAASKDAYLEFSAVCDTEYAPGTANDYMALELTADGSAYAQALKWDEYYLDYLNDETGDASGIAGYVFGYDIPEAYESANFRLRFRWVSDATDNSYQGCYIDDVKLIQTSDGSSDPTLYYLLSGTSMATPHVAGLAALLWGYDPLLSGAQVKDAILETGDSLAALSGKTLTGKRINAEKALASIPTATFTYSTTDPTNQDIIANLYPSEAVTITNNGGLDTYTFAANGSFTFQFTDATGNPNSATATVSNIDKTVPTASVTYSTTDPTNQDVIATLHPDETVTITNNGGLDTYTFAANGSFVFQFTDAAGNTGSATATVANIDKTAPVAAISYSNTNATKDPVLATLVPEETITVTNNGGSATYIFTSNGSFTFQFTDTLGNSGSATATVANIDAGAPGASVTYSTTDPTNQDVIATLHPDEAVTITSAGGNTHTFAANGAFIFTFTDGLGNAGSTVATVTSIDKVAPVITLGEYAATPTNQDITITATTDEGTLNAASHVFTENGSFAFVATDAAGNRTERTVTITNIDKTNPTASVTYSTTSTTSGPVTATLNPSETVTVTNNSGLTTHTFTSNGTFTFQFTDAAGNTGSATATVANISSGSSGGGGGGSSTPPVTSVKANDEPLTVKSAQEGVLTWTLGAHTLKLTIPAGSVGSTTTFSIQQLALDANAKPVAGMSLFSGLMFRIQALSAAGEAVTSFKKNLTATLTVAGMPQDTAALKLFYLDAGTASWPELDGAVFTTSGISFKTMSATTFDVFIKDGAAVAGPETPTPANTDTTAPIPSDQIMDGDIIQCRSSNNPFAVYIVKTVSDKKYIRHIINLSIFNHYKHLKWEQLKQVATLADYSLSGWVRVNTGANGQPGPNDKVWEINGDQTRHWINMSAQQFLTHGGSDEAVYSINQGELDLYKDGPAVMSL